ncbi:MAG: SusC/RagA family TonB-linked outer membrane protein [Chitinophagaceae bacterium]
MKRFMLLFTSLMLSALVFAQNRTITGTVTDDKGEAVPGASVKNKNTTTLVFADNNGRFRVQAKTGDVLEITGSTIEQAEFRVGTEDNITITVKNKVTIGVEVVVTALNQSRQPKELGYAVSKIKTAELTQARAVNLQSGLIGKVSGLNITTTNNSVFENTKINFRGIRSLTGNNQPMLVIDGVPTPLNLLSSLNPNDVQDVNLLKGASASAIYGPDGVNGVIVVRTKRGTKGKPVITVGTTVQVSKVSYLPDLQTQFGSGSSIDGYGNPVYTPYENQQYGPAFNGALVDIGKPLEDGSIQKVPYAPLTKEKRKFWNENGLVVQNDISLATQDFFVSFQDARINGLMPKDKNARTSFRINASKEYNRFRTTFNINYVQQNYNVVNEAGPGGLITRLPSAYTASIYFQVLNIAQHIPFTRYKDWKADKFAQYSNYYNEYAFNPYWAIDNHRQKGRQDDLIGSVELNYKFSNWLAATYRLGTNVSFNFNKFENGPIVVSDYAAANRSATTYTSRPGSVGDNETFTSRVNHEFFLSGKTKAGLFGFNYLSGVQYRENRNKAVAVTGNNLVVPELYNLSNRTGEPGAAEANFKNRLFSFFTSVGLSYKDWAFVEVVGRNDWDSRLSIDHNSYFYPGVNASIVLSDAIPALKGSKTISYLKLRGSVSKSGNVNLGTYALDPTFGPAGGFPYGNLAGFTANNVTPDPNLRPEFVKSIEAGIELGFLKNRIYIEATAFRQNNTDQIIAVQQSWSTGFSTKLANAASFINKGIEFDLRLSPVVKFNNGSIDFKGNVSYNDNKVTALAEGINELTTIGGIANFAQIPSGSPNIQTAAIVGMPAYVFKLTDYKRDPQGRVIVDAITGNPEADDSLVVRGRSLPTWLLGFNPSVTWKGITLSMTVDYKGGHNAFAGIGYDMDFTGISARSAQFGRQRFVFPNSVYWDGSKYVENKNIQVSDGGINFYTSGPQNTGVATNYFFSAASWKLREIALGYDLPASLFAKSNVVKKVNISFVARNLFTWLPKSNQWTDPEFNYTSNNNSSGLSNSFITPPARTFGGSLTVTF